MSFLEILKMSFLNLKQRKLRTFLNLIGIVTGCVMLLMTSAGTQGAREAIQNIFDSSPYARHIEVFAGARYSNSDETGIPEKELIVKGEMDDLRRKRIRKRLVRQYRQKKNRYRDRLIQPEWLKEFEELPHVVEVRSSNGSQCSLSAGGKKIQTRTEGVGFTDPKMKLRIVEGRMMNPDALDEILIHEFTAYRLGYRSDAELKELVGKNVEIEYQTSAQEVRTIFQILSNYGHDSEINMQSQVDFMSAFLQLVNDLDSTSLTEKQKKMIRGLMKKEKSNKAPTFEKKQFKVCGIFKEQDSKSMSEIFR